MAHQQSLPPDRRYLSHIADANDKKEENVRKQKRERHHIIEKLGKDSLPPTNQNSQYWYGSSSERAMSSLPEASREAALPTPPISPVSSRDPNQTAMTLAETAKEIRRLQKSLEDCQSKMKGLDVELEDAKEEVRRLRNERREASERHIRAVCKDQDEEIETCRRREETLIKMLKDKEQYITEMEQRLDEGRERERDLRRDLKEAEGRAEASELRLRESESSINGRKVTVAEDRKPTQRFAGGGKSWEFRRKRGSRETPLGVVWDVVAKGSTYEKARAF